MDALSFEAAVRKIVEADDRYQFDAYIFVQEAIRYTQKSLGREKPEHTHVGAKELLNGIREHALENFGPMAQTVLNEWGIQSCESFGDIVYNLIKFNQATQSPSDSREDFKNGYDFNEVFRKPFLPSKPRAAGAPVARAKMIGQD